MYTSIIANRNCQCTQLVSSSTQSLQTQNIDNFDRELCRERWHRIDWQFMWVLFFGKFSHEFRFPHYKFELNSMKMKSSPKAENELVVCHWSYSLSCDISNAVYLILFTHCNIQLHVYSIECEDIRSEIISNLTETWLIAFFDLSACIAVQCICDIDNVWSWYPCVRCIPFDSLDSKTASRWYPLRKFNCWACA